MKEALSASGQPRTADGVILPRLAGDDWQRLFGNGYRATVWTTPLDCHVGCRSAADAVFFFARCTIVEPRTRVASRKFGTPWGVLVLGCLDRCLERGKDRCPHPLERREPAHGGGGVIRLK